MKEKNFSIRKLVHAAICLALCMVLPFLTGQMQQLGNALCPMHIPVLLCGFLCGGYYAAAVGIIAPLLRFALFGMPPIFPIGTAMCFELLTYGLIAGILYKRLPKKTVNIYVSLVCAMLSGRLVWGIVRFVMALVFHVEFSIAMFVAGAFMTAIPGIVCHIVLIPIIVMALERAGLTVKEI